MSDDLVQKFILVEQVQAESGLALHQVLKAAGRVPKCGQQRKGIHLPTDANRNNYAKKYKKQNKKV